MFDGGVDAAGDDASKGSIRFTHEFAAKYGSWVYGKDLREIDVESARGMRDLMFFGGDRVATDSHIVPFQEILDGLKHQKQPLKLLLH